MNKLFCLLAFTLFAACTKPTVYCSTIGHDMNGSDILLCRSTNSVCIVASLTYGDLTTPPTEVSDCEGVSEAFCFDAAFTGSGALYCARSRVECVAQRTMMLTGPNHVRDITECVSSREFTQP